VSFFKPKFVLLALTSVLLPAWWTSGCSGGAFSAGNTAGSSSSAGNNNGEAGSGAGAGSGVKCGGPEDCDDGQICTTDLCNADGTCDVSPKCAGAQKCCEGDCAECCEDADCDDGVSCTTNTCFSGQCMYVPQDSSCDVTQYCSVKDGCRPRAACGILVGGDPLEECDDKNGCTTDTCADNFCQHDFCGKGAADPTLTLCCEGTGCAKDCCSDAQCDTDNDPCTVGSCKDGKCSLTPLCADGKECCPSADGKTATCGSCCSAAECDDRVGCTVDKCGGGECSHTPGTCEPGYVCDPAKDCQKAATCMANSDCHPSNGCQLNPKCDGGACHFDSCALGTKCCLGAGGVGSSCARCCDASECSDNIECTKDTCGASGCSHEPIDANCPIRGQKCDPLLGCVGCVKDADCSDGLDCTTDSCVQNTCTHVSTCGKYQYCTAFGCSTCVSDSDCQGATTTQNIILPVGCSTSKCVKGQCQTTTQDCGDFQICCPPYGCQLQCGIETQ